MNLYYISYIYIHTYFILELCIATFYHQFRIFFKIFSPFFHIVQKISTSKIIVYFLTAAEYICCHTDQRSDIYIYIRYYIRYISDICFLPTGRNTIVFSWKEFSFSFPGRNCLFSWTEYDRTNNAFFRLLNERNFT